MKNKEKFPTRKGGPMEGRTLTPPGGPGREFTRRQAIRENKSFKTPQQAGDEAHAKGLASIFERVAKSKGKRYNPVKTSFKSKAHGDRRIVVGGYKGKKAGTVLPKPVKKPVIIEIYKDKRNKVTKQQKVTKVVRHEKLPASKPKPVPRQETRKTIKPSIPPIKKPAETPKTSVLKKIINVDKRIIGAGVSFTRSIPRKIWHGYRKIGDVAEVVDTKIAPRVEKQFKKHGLTVNVPTGISRRIASFDKSTINLQSMSRKELKETGLVSAGIIAASTTGSSIPRIVGFTGRYLGSMVVGTGTSRLIEKTPLEKVVGKRGEQAVAFTGGVLAGSAAFTLSGSMGRKAVKTAGKKAFKKIKTLEKPRRDIIEGKFIKKLRRGKPTDFTGMKPKIDVAEGTESYLIRKSPKADIYMKPRKLLEKPVMKRLKTSKSFKPKIKKEYFKRMPDAEDYIGFKTKPKPRAKSFLGSPKRDAGSLLRVEGKMAENVIKKTGTRQKLLLKTKNKQVFKRIKQPKLGLTLKTRDKIGGMPKPVVKPRYKPKTILRKTLKKPVFKPKIDTRLLFKEALIGGSSRLITPLVRKKPIKVKTTPKPIPFYKPIVNNKINLIRTPKPIQTKKQKPDVTPKTLTTPNLILENIPKQKQGIDFVFSTPPPKKKTGSPFKPTKPWFGVTPFLAPPPKKKTVSKKKAVTPNRIKYPDEDILSMSGKTPRRMGLTRKTLGLSKIKEIEDYYSKII